VPPRASVSDGRQPTEREEAAAVGGPATSQGGVWIRIASSRSSRRTRPAHCLFASLARRAVCLLADAQMLPEWDGSGEGPLGPTLAGPSAAAASSCQEQDSKPGAGASGARTVDGVDAYRLRRFCTALSGGRLTGPQDCQAAHHASWRRACHLTAGPALYAADPSHGRRVRPRAPSGRRSAMGCAHP
jgi:hypothetical protein